jgi:hypothetical protein
MTIGVNVAKLFFFVTDAMDKLCYRV